MRLTFNVKNLDASGWNRAKQVVMSFGSYVTPGGVMMPWNRKKISETMKADAEAYAEDLAEEAENLRKEAYALIHRFVLPGQVQEEETKPKPKPKQRKENEPSEQSTSDRYWEAERALLNAMEEGMQKEIEISDWERRKNKDEQDKWYAEQLAALEENVKNGFTTRDQAD